MRTLLLTSLLALVACSDPLTQPVWEPEGPPIGSLYTVSGVLIDSLNGSPLTGVRVSAGRDMTETDAAGQWTLTVTPGLVTVAASPIGYETVRTTLSIGANTYVPLAARRLAPLVQGCVREGDRVVALVSDLQGRKTIERWDRSEVYVLDAAGAYRIGAREWGYTALDYISWQVTLGPIAPEVTAIRWNLYDDEGHAYSGICEPATPPMEE